jgi:hypothetical protein
MMKSYFNNDMKSKTFENIQLKEIYYHKVKIQLKHRRSVISIINVNINELRLIKTTSTTNIFQISRTLLL